MAVTFICGFVLMAGLFLMLLAGVGFIQDKKFFGSAPEEIRAVIPDTKPERFCGQHAVGWCLMALSVLIMAGAVLFAAVNGIRSGFGFGKFYLRFTAMLLMLKAFDIGFFDWVLLCNGGLGFFPHFYPETKAVSGRHLFGFNRKTHAAQILGGVVLMLPAAWICTLF